MLTHYPFTTLVRSSDHLLIIRKIVGRRGRFTYQPISDTPTIDRLLSPEISVEDFDHVCRLFSGLCTKKEAVHMVGKISAHRQELLALLEAVGILRTVQKKAPVIHASYFLQDGYRIQLITEGQKHWIVEYEKGREISRSIQNSLREGRGILAETLDNIARLEGTQFYIEKL